MSTFDIFTSIVRSHRPQFAVILGSGLGSVPHHFEDLASISFGDVPGLVAPSVHGHSGKISLGAIGDQPLLVFRGRLHFYEGHSWERVAAPIHVAAELGVRVLLLTNAAGGIHDSLWPGDLMVLRDHLFLQMPQTVEQIAKISDVNDGLEARPTYSPRLIDLLRDCERERGRELMAGVYAAVTGPCYETPAEIHALRAMGADAVGMSTAFEAMTAVELEIEVSALSCITNKAAGLTAGTLDHREVLANASKPAERISELLEMILPRLRQFS